MTDIFIPEVGVVVVGEEAGETSAARARVKDRVRVKREERPTGRGS